MRAFPPAIWALALTFLPACGGSGSAGVQARPTPSGAPVEVHAAPVELAGFERSVTAAGELAPLERARLATKVPGRVAELLVDRGDEVRRGDVLARLEERE